MNESIGLADGYIERQGLSSPPNYTDYLNDTLFYSNLRVIFLQQLNRRIEDIGPIIMAKIDSDLSVTSSVDPNVHQEWVPLGIRVGYT